MNAPARGGRPGARALADGGAGRRSFVDLHCHTSASFDSLASPASVARAAAGRGLTHLAVTDHGTIDGALAARDAAPDGLTVLIGEEIKTREGDLIAVFLSSAVPNGLPPREAIAAVREQGGLLGIPHPFDRLRGSMGRTDGGRTGGDDLIALSAEVDWIEAWNARILVGDGNVRAAELAAAHRIPGVAVSDAHTTVEVGVAATLLEGDPATADGLRAALAGHIQLMTGRASLYARLATPAAKLIKRARGDRARGAA
ncbi:MAG TPA: PHP-associated domain-containing protein [Candidatus Limnocylindrales bacterium]|nr:PHP-associated domain-containing protein [Candidatus Limnocylindrales bacterium]